jgi:hypothetical protein
VGSPNGYVIDGLHALYASARTGAVGEPVALTGLWGGYPSFSMNARGDAVAVWDECCPMALRSRRRAPVGSFGPVEDVQPPIQFEGSRGGRWTLAAHVDAFGNARAAWLDSEPDPIDTFVGEDGPLISQQPPEVVWSGDELAPVLPPEPGGVDPDGGGDPGGGEPVGELPVPPQVSPPSPMLPPPAPPPPARSLRARADAAPPVVRLRVGRRPAARAGRRLRLHVRCSERCAVHASGRSGRAVLRPVGAVMPAGRTRRLALRVPRAALRRPIRVDLAATDRAGNVARVRRTVRAR